MPFSGTSARNPAGSEMIVRSCSPAGVEITSLRPEKMGDCPKAPRDFVNCYRGVTRGGALRLQTRRDAKEMQMFIARRHASIDKRNNIRRSGQEAPFYFLLTYRVDRPVPDFRGKANQRRVTTAPNASDPRQRRTLRFAGPIAARPRRLRVAAARSTSPVPICSGCHSIDSIRRSTRTSGQARGPPQLPTAAPGAPLSPQPPRHKRRM
jgi:hypothetical protein